MEWVETTGRTVAEAKEKALDQLGVDNSDAQFEVVAEEKTGLFGRLKSEARVRARVAPSAPRSKDQGSRNRRGKRNEKSDRQDKPVKKTPSNRDNDENPSNRPKARRPKDGPKPPKPAAAGSEQGAQVIDSEEQVPLTEQGSIAEGFLQDFFSAIGASTTISTTADEDEHIVRVDIQGANLSHLIGPRGSTLHSLQEITRTVVQRQTGSRSGRIVLDISGYREKRKAALEEFSRKVADEVLKSSETKQLEPMNPADRKIVHDTINGIDGVATTSEGEEPRRFVVIRPS